MGKKTNGTPATELPVNEIEESTDVAEQEQKAVFIKKVTEYLRYQFTDAELLDLSKQLARKLAEQERAERELKEVSTQLKAAVTAKENEVSTLSHLVQNGYEYRNIECEVRFDHPEKGKKTMLRMDTGEIVSESKMTGEDLQGQLFWQQEQEAQRTALQ